MSADPGAVRLTVVTGFLGSGKTSLLRGLLRHPALSDSAVVINEFGDVALDHLLVEQGGSDVVVLASGCVCCTADDDFMAALERLLARRRLGELPPFRRVILETTGIADPGPVVQAVLARPVAGTPVELDRVVTVVDALTGDASLDAHPECLRQVVMADVLLLSKTRLADPAVVAQLRSRLAELAPGVPLLLQEDAATDPMALFAGAGFRHVLPPAAAVAGNGSRHDRRYATFSLGWDEPAEWAEVVAWLEGLLTVRGDDILRLKGLLRIRGEDRPVVIQGVQHMLFPPERLPAWPRGRARTELVFITRHFTPAAARASLAPFVQLPVEAA